MKIFKRGLSDLLFLVISYLLLFSCSPASPKLKPDPIILNEKIVSANNEAFSRPAVDVLFVIDDSGSMSSHQNNLARNMDTFVDEFTKLKLIDYHIGVISSSINDPDTLAGDGHLSDLGGYTYVDRNTPNAVTVLKTNLKLGAIGSATEKFFDPIALALSDPLLNGYNGGFYRKNAHLVVIILTDTDDQSSRHTASSIMSFLLNLKNNDKKKILSYAAYSPTSDWNCPGEGYGTRELDAFLGQTINAGKNIVSLCDVDFGQKLVDFSKEIVDVVNKPIVLSRPPVISSIKVMYGTQEIPSHPETGWSFDPIQNAIVFGPNLQLDESQPEGTGIDVSFDSAYFPEESP